MGLEIISEYKKKAGMTTEELSSASGVPVGTLNKILSGATRDPKLETLKSIAKVLGLSLNDFDDERNVGKDNLTVDEIEHIKKYRLLDEDGRHHVDMELEHESGRVKQITALTDELEAYTETEQFFHDRQLEKRPGEKSSASEEGAG